MREIKFRGKRLDNGEWAYGAFVPDALEQTHGKMVTWGFIRRYRPNQTVESVEMIEVDRNTVGQYTGLKDKNGTEIYEDDLVAVADYTNWEGLYKVAWDKDGSMYVIEDAYGHRENLCEFEEYLVKGNIHDAKDADLSPEEAQELKAERDYWEREAKKWCAKLGEIRLLIGEQNYHLEEEI